MIKFFLDDNYFDKGLPNSIQYYDTVYIINSMIEILDKYGVHETDYCIMDNWPKDNKGNRIYEDIYRINFEENSWVVGNIERGKLRNGAIFIDILSACNFFCWNLISTNGNMPRVKWQFKSQKK